MTTSASAQDLLARASSRNRVEPADARAGAVFERVAVGPESFFVKRLSPASDWVMRIAGDHVHRPYLIWRSGLMDQAPDLIDHTVVTMDLTDDAVLTIVMRDVGESLVPPGDTTVPAAQHARFIAHMAALSSAFWNWEDRLGLRAGICAGTSHSIGPGCRNRRRRRSAGSAPRSSATGSPPRPGGRNSSMCA